MDVMLAAHPEQERGQGHENARDTKGPTVSVVLGDAGDDQEREEGSEVDAPVEQAVRPLEQVALAGVELVADKGGNTRFDAAAAEGDQRQSGVEKPEFVLLGLDQIGQGQHPVSEAVEEGDEEDGLVASQDPVRQPGSEEGHEVHTEDKQVDDFRGFRGSLAEVFGDVEGQDAAHPVEAEPLASLVADDVLDLRRERIRGGG